MNTKVCAPSYNTSWGDINWSQANKDVLRIQMRIAKAYKEGRIGKVTVMQHLITSSFTGKAIAVKQVSDNKGKRTPGIDGELWETDSDKMLAIDKLNNKGYIPSPLLRTYIRKADGRQRPLSIPTMIDRAK